MKLLKLGRLEKPVGRWKDSFQLFDGISVIKLYDDEAEDPAFNYIRFPKANLALRILSRVSSSLNENKGAKWVLDFAFSLLRNSATKGIQPLLSKCEYDEVHVSYNDYDESAFLLTLLYPYLNHSVRITRPYKETRPEWKYLERKAFELSNRIVFNEIENVSFFEKKYGKSFFKNKKILTGLDEDAIGDEHINSVKYLPKLSETDGRRHLVILCGRAFSDASDKRSGSRLYYVALIKEFLDAGFAVHLHTLKMIPDSNGVNQYEVLKEKYKESFFIEPPLSFDDNHFVESYGILSRYDCGVLHNFVEGTPNTEFDKYNIPHRYYEYELAHVAPILLRGKTIVMERLLEEKKSGVVYSKPSEISLKEKCVYDIRSFSDYIKALYE